jgi:anaerobic magnesium-protoporphyrin IX monomethyl ester cyclase
MNILFLITPNTHDPRYGAEAAVSRRISRFPMLGLLYVAAYHQVHSQDNVDFVDAQGLSYAVLETILQARQPDIVAMSVHSHNLVDVWKTARLAHALCPRCIVILGGHHATIFPRETALLEGVDFVIAGDGESAFNSLISALRASASEDHLRTISGISWIHSATGHISSTRAVERDLDTLPSPVDLRISENMLKDLCTDTGAKAYIHASRGCPHGCAFCMIRRTGYRCRSATSICDEMSAWTQRGVASFLFLDDSFTVARDRVLDFCGQICRRQLRVAFALNARVDSVDRELLSTLSAAGCSRIYYGVESGLQQSLDTLQKRTTLSQIADAFAWTREFGIETYAYLMIGIPGERRQDIQESLRFAAKLRPDRARISIFQPRAGTPLYASLLASGVLRSDYWKEFAEHPTEAFVIPHWHPELSPEELEELRRWGQEILRVA